jgi:hypothetical protein
MSCIVRFSDSYFPGPCASWLANGFQFVHVEQSRLVPFASDHFSELQNQYALSLLLPLVAPEREPKIDQERNATCGDGRND